MRKALYLTAGIIFIATVFFVVLVIPTVCVAGDGPYDDCKRDINLEPRVAYFAAGVYLAEVIAGVGSRFNR